MAQARSKSSNAAGFSLIEVVVAMAILTVVSLGVAQLFAASTRVNRIARGQTSTTMLAEQKIEQIRSMTWGFDSTGEGLPVSDTTSNLTIYPTDQTGTGMNPTPADSLEQNTTGCVDFLDANGAWVGTGGTPPGSAVYIRRWSIQPLPTNPNNTLVIQVLVTPIANEAARQTTGSARVRMPGDTLLTTVKTRKSA
ncbi:MAG: prepilin-type N-terminal cleavage/methylation domain-containing protein [Vicinamibacterales bacterium]